MNRISVVIVTYNRIALLCNCLGAIAKQSRKPDQVVVVDNASTDQTQQWLEDWLPRHLPHGKVIRLVENLGGAGGFAAGMKAALADGCDWVWMMDDDAEPHRDALARLLDRELKTDNIYASMAVAGPKLSWPMVPEGRADSVIFFTNQVPDELTVDLVPFIGILVSKELVNRIGVPDKDFFLVADDVEYSFRARRQGAKVVLVGTSQIEHPASEWYSISLVYRRLHVLKLTPWKRYYEVRNRFLLHKYYSHRLGFQNYAGWLLRLIVTLRHEKDMLGQLRAYIGGLIDGSLERKGKRHTRWGL